MRSSRVWEGAAPSTVTAEEDCIGGKLAATVTISPLRQSPARREGALIASEFASEEGKTCVWATAAAELNKRMIAIWKRMVG